MTRMSLLLAAGLIASPYLPCVSAIPIDPRQSNLINAILSDLVSICPVNVAVTDVDDTIALGEELVATTLGVSTTLNAGSRCADVTIVFARGTTETGNVGLLAGPPFFQALQSTLGSSVSVAVQGVNYDAGVPGFLEGGDPAGTQQMVSDIQQVLKSCPQTKLVVSGYSQGGQLLHNSAKILGSSVMARVSAVVIFGDPDNGQAVQGIDPSKVLVICHAGDNICQGGDLILLPHLTYAENANQAASFVAGHL